MKNYIKIMVKVISQYDIRMSWNKYDICVVKVSNNHIIQSFFYRNIIPSYYVRNDYFIYHIKRPKTCHLPLWWELKSPFPAPLWLSRKWSIRQCKGMQRKGSSKKAQMGFRINPKSNGIAILYHRIPLSFPFPLHPFPWFDVVGEDK